MKDILYRWPDAATVSSRVPKEKFYEHAKLPPAVRDRFVSDVARITWAYKLATVNVNLPDSEAVPEIQVFRIVAKSADVSDQVLTAIDRAIASPIIFEISRESRGASQVRMVAAHKVPGASAPIISQYFTTDWLYAGHERRPMPAAINLTELYSHLLEPLTPLRQRLGESLSDVADRLRAVGKLEREIAALQRKIKNEKQFNRKVELSHTLRTKQAQLEQQR